MHADSLSHILDNRLYSVLGLMFFVAAFILIVIRVIRMDRREVDTLQNLPFEQATGATGETKDE